MKSRPKIALTIRSPEYNEGSLKLNIPNRHIGMYLSLNAQWGAVHTNKLFSSPFLQNNRQPHSSDISPDICTK